MKKALKEVISAIENGKKVEDGRGVFYKQDFGENFLEYLKKSLENCESCSKETKFEKLKNSIKELISYYYQMPENGAGGYLHIFLDDGNTDYSSLYFCQNECKEHGDTLGYFLCDVLLMFTEEELWHMYKHDRWGMRS
jgi:hypothetical protein